ncbi:MAG TPA: TIGR01777 family oxidoreductase [Tepidisphaeraceae bacterium]|nr:TIGR01777 family oxidoreductase [Tepidisphaeraceae bacterium]
MHHERREKDDRHCRGSGFLGRAVTPFMIDLGWDVIVLSRRSSVSVPGAQVFQWDGQTLGPWGSAMDGAQVVLNLAGRSVNCRYNARNRAEIERSRIDSTRMLSQAISQAKDRPRVWINSSTATIYRHAEDRPQDEYTGELGSDFSMNVAEAWEKEFFNAPAPGVRKVTMRTSMVMGPDRGGPFAAFRMLVRLRLGGKMGSGKQYVSWIHIEDYCRAIEFLIDRDDISGVVNITSPHPLRNDEFMRDIRHAMGVRLDLPATRWMLEIGAILLRTETELPLKSRFVVPKRLLESGFVFKHPQWRTSVPIVNQLGRISDEPRLTETS